MNIVILMPSRGRPEQCREAVGRIFATAENRCGVEVIVGVDEDDPSPYEKLLPRTFRMKTDCGMQVLQQLQSIATREGLLSDRSIVGWAADDIRYETPGWDGLVIAEARRWPVSLIFGEDTIQHGHIATHPFFTQRFIEAVGGLFQPGYRHLFADTELTEIARMAGVLRYLPNLVTRHLHYTQGTAPSDATYARSERFNDADKALFDRRSGERTRLATLLRSRAGL